jgi:hypothetical protein
MSNRLSVYEGATSRYRKRGQRRKRRGRSDNDIESAERKTFDNVRASKEKHIQNIVPIQLSLLLVTFWVGVLFMFKYKPIRQLGYLVPDSTRNR